MTVVVCCFSGDRQNERCPGSGLLFSCVVARTRDAGNRSTVLGVIAKQVMTVVCCLSGDCRNERCQEEVICFDKNSSSV